MASILPRRKKIMGSQVREKWGGKDGDAPPCGRTRVGMGNDSHCCLALTVVTCFIR